MMKLATSFTTIPGGNMVDELPPASFGPSCNFSILFLRFLWSGKLIFGIFVGLFFIKY